MIKRVFCVKERLYGGMYSEILSQNLLLVTALMKCDWVFQHDNDPKHHPGDRGMALEEVFQSPGVA